MSQKNEPKHGDVCARCGYVITANEIKHNVLEPDGKRHKEKLCNKIESVYGYRKHSRKIK